MSRSIHMDHIKMMDVCMKSSLDDRNITASGSLTTQVVTRSDSTWPSDLFPLTSTWPFDLIYTSNLHPVTSSIISTLLDPLNFLFRSNLYSLTAKHWPLIWPLTSNVLFDLKCAIWPEMHCLTLNVLLVDPSYCTLFRIISTVRSLELMIS